MRLLGRDVPVSNAEGGSALAVDSAGEPAPADPVRNYLARAFGNRIGDAWAAMDALAAKLQPGELNPVGFRLYEQFQPEVPEGVKGWGAKGELHLGRVRPARP